MPDWAPNVNCICRDWDRYTCVARRYNRDLDSVIMAGDEGCQCACHDVYEDDMRELEEEEEYEHGNKC